MYKNLKFQIIKYKNYNNVFKIIYRNLIFLETLCIIILYKMYNIKTKSNYKYIILILVKIF